MICYERKCIFVHIPKCGGSSIEKVLWPNPENRIEQNLWMGFIDEYRNKYQTGGLQHLLARHILIEVGSKVFYDFFKFSITRNPWDKAVSQFSYFQQRKDLHAYLGMTKTADFKTYLTLTAEKPHVQWEPQYKFLYDENGESLVDFVGRFENFQADVRHVLKQLGITVDELPHEKKSERANYAEYYDDEAKEMVANVYRKDIELFGYEF